MEIVTASPQTVQSLTLPFEEIRIAVLGDIQWDGTDIVDVDRLKRHIAWCVEQKCYFIGSGDYVDFLSPTNRERVNDAKLYDSATKIIDRMAEQLENELFQILEPTRGRWLGLVQGHHFYEYSDGTTIDTSLAKRLQSPFLGDAGIILLKFQEPGHTQNATLYLWHGQGGGSTKGGIDSAFKRLQLTVQADIYVMGHYHQRGAWVDQQLFVDAKRWKHPRLEYRPIWSVLGGGWLKGYKQGNHHRGRAQGTYIEKRGLRPVHLGGPIIYIRPKFGRDPVAKNNGIPRLDINVSP